jgi:hypothetical protein
MFSGLSSNSSEIPFEVLMNMVNDCGRDRYAGYYDGNAHFHLIDKPILTKAFIQKRISTFADAILTSLLKTELGNSLDEFLHKFIVANNMYKPPLYQVDLVDGDNKMQVDDDDIAETTSRNYPRRLVAITFAIPLQIYHLTTVSAAVTNKLQIK